MKTIYCSWKDEEIIKLFSFVEDEKKKNRSLLSIFKSYADLTKRQPNSVRNYYYLELSELQKNAEKRQRLCIDLKNHQKIKQTPFNQDEEKQVVKNILKLCAKGMSVRKACLELSCGDLGKMIRYQNKYRNVLKFNQKLLDLCEKELESEGIIVATQKKYVPRLNNVLVMPRQNSALSDKDIEALFMGLVRLVKRVANEEAQNQAKQKFDGVNQSLTKAYVQLSSKDNKIKELSQNLEKLKNENNTLKNKLQQKRSEEVSKIVKSNKMQQLKKFAGNFQNNSEKLKA